MTKLNPKYLEIAVIASLASFLDKFDALEGIIKKDSDWDFFMTTAGVGLYLIISKANSSEQKEVREMISELDKQMPEALDDFNSFQKPEGLLLPSVGYWVILNLKGAEPTKEEFEIIAPAIGIYLSKVINDLISTN